MRNVTSNYLKCIASQCLSLPYVIFSCVLKCFVSRSLYRYPRAPVQRRDNHHLSLLRREIVVNYKVFASTSVNMLGSSSRLASPNSMWRNHLELILNIVSFTNQEYTNWFAVTVLAGNLFC